MWTPDQALSKCTFAQLRKVIQQLGQDGGSMTPSVYETAQVLRFCPELVEDDKVVDWLLRCQHPDGGWGDPATPLYRDVPTMASLLALQGYRQHERVRHASTAAQRFLEEQDRVISPADDEYLPVAIELIIPRLMDEAHELGLRLSRCRFQHIEELGTRRRKLLAQHPPKPDSSATFSWEAWGTSPDIELVGYGGVGHNPAATAWWLSLDRDRPSTVARERAIHAIMQASHVARARIIGVVPDAWPMNRFEQSFVLHLISIAGLLTDCKLIDVLAPQLEDLYLALRGGGIGFADGFEADGDDTAAAVAVLAAAGLSVDYSVLSPFARADRFVAYPFETHGSFTVTARASQAARIIGCDTASWRPYILRAQQPDGWWTSDKWNRSRLFGTCIALTALTEDADAAKSAAVQAILDNQYDDGGWGCFGRSTVVETAYAVLALCSTAQVSGCEANCIEAITAAKHYLRRRYSVRRIGTEPMWICKDLYSARRVDQVTVLCALLAPFTSSHSRLGDHRQPQYHRNSMVAS